MGKFWRGLAIGIDRGFQLGFGGGEVFGVPDLAQLAADALADGDCRGMMDGVLRQVELAALPDGAAQHGLAGGLQAGMIVGSDESHAAHAASDQVFQEGPPVGFGLGESHRHAEHTAAAIRPDTRLQGLLALSLSGIGSKASWPSIADNTAASRTTPPCRDFS